MASRQARPRLALRAMRHADYRDGRPRHPDQRDLLGRTVSGVLGNVGANGSWVAQRLDANTLILRNSVGTGTYTDRGTRRVCAIRSPNRGDRQHNAHRDYVQYGGLPARMTGMVGQATCQRIRPVRTCVLELNLIPNNPTHDHLTGLIALAAGKTRRDWLVIFPDVGRSAVAFQGWVSDLGVQTPVDGLLRANPVISIDGRMEWAVTPLP